MHMIYRPLLDARPRRYCSFDCFCFASGRVRPVLSAIWTAHQLHCFTEIVGVR